jgi:hypothetical protein
MHVQAFGESQKDRDQSSPVVVPVRVFKPSNYRLKFSIVTHDVPRSGPNPSSPPKRSEVSLSFSSNTCMSASYLCLGLANYEFRSEQTHRLVLGYVQLWRKRT